MSDNRSEPRFGRFLTAREGAATVEFGIMLPAFLITIVVLIELIFMSIVYVQTGEAARRGTRIATIVDPIANIDDLEEGTPIECRVTSGTVTCTNASVQAAESFDRIYQDMASFMPTLQQENIRVVYRHAGVGDPDALNGVIPVVTVRIINFEHHFILAALVPGAPAKITLPVVHVSLMGYGKEVGGS